MFNYVILIYMKFYKTIKFIHVSPKFFRSEHVPHSILSAVQVSVI